MVRGPPDSRRDLPCTANFDYSTLAFGGGLRRNTVYRKSRECDRLPIRGRMDDSCLKILKRGNRPGGAADCRPRARRRRAGPVLARRLQVRHAGHQGRGARRLGRPQRPRHGPLRLFRPRRVRRDLRRWHHRPLAGGKRRGVSRLLRRSAGRDRLVHGRLARAAAGARARAAGRCAEARRSRASC